MKGYATMVGLALVTLAVTGTQYWRSTPTVPTYESATAQATALVRSFAGSAPVAEHVDLNKLYGGRQELLDPALTLPQSHKYRFGPMRNMRLYSTSCAEVDRPSTLNPALAKTAQWYDFVCGLDPLPEDFFRTAPYMHYRGQSFVSLAIRHGSPVHATREFVETHINGLHIQELSQPHVPATGPYAVLSSLKPAELAGLHRQRPLVIGAHFVLFRAGVGRGPGATAIYNAYTRARWDRHVSGIGLRATSAARDGACTTTEADICWKASPTRGGAVFYGVAAAGSVGVLALAFVMLLVGRRRAQVREAEARQFILRTLTHELRTPATSLNLSLESFRADYDALPQGSQTAFLRMCDQLQRLNRTIAASTSYLQSHQASPSERFKMETIDSIHAFFAPLADAYAPDELSVDLPREDTSLCTDPRWLQVCLQNLTDNALRHGEGPVSVRVSMADGVLVVAVQDAGDSTGLHLGEMGTAFHRGDDSQGLGLGLSIVVKTARDLGGALTHTSRPTIFTLRIPGAS